VNSSAAQGELPRRSDREKRILEFFANIFSF
jgi:hypothetical protein